MIPVWVLVIMMTNGNGGGAFTQIEFKGDTAKATCEKAAAKAKEKLDVTMSATIVATCVEK